MPTMDANTFFIIVIQLTLKILHRVFASSQPQFTSNFPWLCLFNATVLPLIEFHDHLAFVALSKCLWEKCGLFRFLQLAGVAFCVD